MFSSCHIGKVSDTADTNRAIIDLADLILTAWCDVSMNPPGVEAAGPEDVGLEAIGISIRKECETPAFRQCLCCSWPDERYLMARRHEAQIIWLPLLPIEPELFISP
ncbi:hypothetical protein HY17_10645 [Hyphomonas sp. CY54-11-8]|nr:hypothetical protein HY17_10645 [Hyphomonas sp. CY54-11-8]